MIRCPHRRNPLSNRPDCLFDPKAPTTFLGNSLGPLTGGTAGWFGIRRVFVVTAALLVANLLWVWFTMREPPEQPASDGD